MGKAILPLPNDTQGDATVVASVWLDDESIDRPTALLLLLQKEPPYYSVATVHHHEGDWYIDDEDLFPNIVPAVEAYEQSGGDY